MISNQLLSGLISPRYTLRNWRKITKQKSRRFLAKWNLNENVKCQMNNLCNRRRSGSIFLCKTLTATLALDYSISPLLTVFWVLAVRGAEVIWRRRCAGDWRPGAGVRRMEVRGRGWTLSRTLHGVFWLGVDQWLLFDHLCFSFNRCLTSINVWYCKRKSTTVPYFICKVS